MCGDMAHVITCSPMSFLTDPYPFITVTLYPTCGNGSVCEETFSAINDELAKQAGIPHRALIRKREGPSGQALASSCRTCNETGKKLKRCMQCKLIRYCGEQCQRKDWAR